MKLSRRGLLAGVLATAALRWLPAPLRAEPLLEPAFDSQRVLFYDYLLREYFTPEVLALQGYEELVKTEIAKLPLRPVEGKFIVLPVKFGRNRP